MCSRMNGTAAQQPPRKNPTPEERIDWFRRKPVISIPIAVALMVAAVIHWGAGLMADWDKLWLRFHPKTYDVGIYHASQTGFDRTLLPIFWRVNDGGDQTGCPVGFFLILSITNLQSDPMTIIAYEVDEKEKHGDWIQLPQIPLQSYQHLYSTMVGGLTSATQIEINPPPLDQQISSTATIEPHKPLVGSAAFEDPDPTVELEGFRVRLRDSLHQVFTSGLLDPVEDQKKVKSSLPGADLIVNPEKQINLMKLSLRPHCL
jgi:hypothetical protein